MGKDYIDWGGYPVGDQTYPLKDLAELAARLGSPVVYSRSGAVAWTDDFEHGVQKWDLSKSGAGSNPALSATYALSKGFSAVLDPGTSAGDYSSLLVKQPQPPAGKWGFSFRWMCAVEPQYLYSRMYVLDDETAYDFMVRYQGSDNTWQYKDTAGDWQDIATLNLVHYDETLWHFLKLTIDFDNKCYSQLQFDAVVYDLSDYELAGGAVVDQDRVSLSLFAYSQGASMKPVYIDDAIFTYNEP